MERSPKSWTVRFWLVTYVMEIEIATIAFYHYCTLIYSYVQYS